jgi:hypothetical protein
MARPTESRVKLVIYVLPETEKILRSTAGSLGRSVDRLVEGWPKKIERSNSPPIQSTIKVGPHPVSCGCEVCTLRRLG